MSQLQNSSARKTALLTRISHKILDEDGQDVATDLPIMGREHCQSDKARPIGGKDGVTDCSDSPRVCEKCGLSPIAPTLPRLPSRVGRRQCVGKAEAFPERSASKSSIFRCRGVLQLAHMQKILSILLVLLCFTPSLFAGEEEPYVTCDFLGQLGNQCFEVAATLAFAWDHGVKPVFPNLVRTKKLGIPTNQEKVFWRLDVSSQKSTSEVVYKEPIYNYSPIPYHPHLRIIGYFHSEKYFRKYKEKICSLFEPKEEIVQYLVNKYGNLLSHPNTVSIHIRTYSIEKPRPQGFPLHSREYVQKAISHFDPDSLFLVFSDDIQWCKKQLQGLAKNMIYIVGEPYYHDFYLMSLCHHNIISNSTFSWWAAYLNKNPNKIVIAPKKVFWNAETPDLYPEEWITLE